MKNKSRRKTLIIIITAVVLVVVIFSLSLVFGLLFFMKNSDSYKTAISYIEKNPEIIEKVGDIDGYGFIVSGSVGYSNGFGEAEYTIKVKGSKDTIKVRLQLEKSSNTDWEVVKSSHGELLRENNTNNNEFDDPVKTAINFIETNPEIIAKVGEIKGYDFFIEGSLHGSPKYGKYGSIDFTVKVEGDDKALDVFFRLWENGKSEWEIIHFYYEELIENDN